MTKSEITKKRFRITLKLSVWIVSILLLTVTAELAKNIRETIKEQLKITAKPSLWNLTQMMLIIIVETVS